MKNYKANPVVAPLITKPGESKEYVGTRNVTNLLPEIFKTQVNKRFLDSTLEQLMSSGSLQTINHYLGEKTKTRIVDDSYIEDGRTSDPYQFTPGLVNKDTDGNVSNAIAYDDLLHNMNFSQVQLNQNNRVFDEKGYTLDLPINYDMYTNYHRYFWAVDVVPVIDIIPAASDPITIDDIVGKFEYTTPTLSNGKTLTLKNGMRIRFESIDIERTHQSVAGNKVFTSPISNPLEYKVYLNNFKQTEGVDYNKISATEYEFVTAPAVGDEIEIHAFWVNSGTYRKEEVYIVDGVKRPEGIKFTKQFTPVDGVENYGKRVWFNQTIYSGKQPTKFDEEGESFEFKPFDLRELKIQTREYTCEERWAQDQSAWARSNLWMSQDTIETICEFTDDDPSLYTIEQLRATRPIIEYKANIKKYEFGTQHLEFVDYMFDQLDPAVDIVGQPFFDLARHLITQDWVHKGYNKGDLVKVARAGAITYWDCKRTHGEAYDPTMFENNKYWNQVYSKVIEDDELVLFINSTNATYNNKIYRASGNGTSLSLTLVYDLTDYSVGHKVMCVNGYNAVFYDSYDGLIYSGSEWYWDGTTWVYGQQKEHSSAGALFQLYDTELTELHDATKYPNSTFKGDRIFDYGKGSTRYDESLGFNPRYVDYGNTPGLSFDLELGAKRYHYNVTKENSGYHQTFDTGNIEDIPGYYFYRMLDTDKYYNGWKLLRSGQPVKRHASFVSSGTVICELGTTDLKTDNKFIIRKDKGGFVFATTSTQNSCTKLHEVSDINPFMFVSKDRTYKLQTQFPISEIEFVDFEGSALTNVSISNIDTYNAELQVTSAFANTVIRYREVGNTSNTGLIYVDTNTIFRNLEVYVNGVTTTSYTLNGSLVTVNGKEDDIVDVYWWTDSELNKRADGNFEPADTHLYNAFNEWATEVSFGDLQEHLRLGMTNIPGFTGDYFGDNNYENLPHVHDFAGTIRKQPYSTALLNQLSADVDTNIYNSIAYAANSYKKFKFQFLQKVKQLHNTIAIETPVHELVDSALASINLGKNDDSMYANSNMAMFKDYESVDYTWESGQTQAFTLPQVVNQYHDASNHIQAWVEDNDGWHSLVKGVDYTLTANKITITRTIAYKTASNSATLHVRWYAQNAVSFIPPSAVKLGLIKPYTPSLTSQDIFGHDGSIVERLGTEIIDRSDANFRIEDAASWDLELRIYNNLYSEIDSIIDYKEIMPNANRPTTYTWDEYVAALEPDFKRFAQTAGLESLTDPTYYDAGNRFTWNYSSVGPGIGGWRGLYTYYFNTYRPDTHPWEMFGYNKKPTWWDTRYSWNAGAKRTALIESLKTGQYSDPIDSPKYNINYAYTAYDWDNNVLVTPGGNLNNPITAGVVTAPTTVAAAQNFVFGDMGSVEFEWIQTSEFKIVQQLALLRLRPLWMTNNFFTSTNKEVIRNINIPDDIIVDKDALQLSNYTTAMLSNTFYNDSIIEKVNVKSSSAVTTTPEITIFGNYGTGATATAIVENNSVVSVSVTNPGYDYQSKPGIVFSDGDIVTETFLLKNAKRYSTGLNTAVVDFAQYNITNASVIEDRFSRASIQPIIKAGGFVNPNRQSLILESSQDKGKVNVPEENIQTMLYMNQPNHETFMGGIQFTKKQNSYEMTGIDKNAMYANYFEPLDNSKKIYVNLSQFSLVRYEKYSQTPTRIYYGEVLPSLQDAYTFILGHSEYLRADGWITNWKETADNFALWAETANEGESFLCIPSTIRYEIADGPRGYYDAILHRYDGINNMLDENGNQVPVNNVVVSRPLNSSEDQITTIEAKTADVNILGLRLYRVELEHIIVFDNETDFDDIIYKPEIGQRHKRITWRGARTKDWNGKLYTPGYFVNDNTIIDNFDTVANSSLEYFNESTIDLNNSAMVDTARFNIGYNKPQWSEYLNLDDDVVFNFTKGTRKYRGTKYGLNAFMRNTSMLGGIADAELCELWAVRTADYGDVRSRDTLEFELNKEELNASPQLVKFHADDFPDININRTINIDPTSSLLVTGTTNSPFRARQSKSFYRQNVLEDMDQFENDIVTAGLPLLTETNYRTLNRELFASSDWATTSTITERWQKTEQWNNRKAYKFNDEVIYEGRVWRMRDPDGTSGLQRPNDPIEVVGTVSLPIIPSSGQTLSIDGTVVTIQRTSQSTTLNPIQVTGSGNINLQGVQHNSTLIVGQSSGINQTLVFDNTTSSINFQDVTKTGNITNFFIDGGPNSGKELIIDSVSIPFNATTSSTGNITIEDGFTQAFTSTFVTNTSSISAIVTGRINAIEALRLAVIADTGLSGWNSIVSSYFTNDSGLDILYLQGISNANIATEIDNLIANDITLINSITNNTYANNPALIPASVIQAAQTALDPAPFITNIKNFAVNSSSNVFDANEVIATSGTTVGKRYSDVEIVQEINNAGIPDVTASLSSNGNLLITKTTSDRSQQFSLTITAAGANADVGFNTTNQTITSSGITVIATPDLTLAEVVQQINSAGIANITATALSSGQVQITSTASTLYIGPGSANATIGLNEGVVPATVTVTTTDRTSDLTDTISSINNAGIVGISASNSNNRLRIVSTNETMTIGSGTANNTLGITAQVYFATQTQISNEFNATGSDGLPTFERVVQDPFNMNIWVADNSSQGNINAGYNVYQAMEFGMHITKCCAGINDADEAQISIDLSDYPTTHTAFHNLSIGDYVLIAGSNSIPSIDGVHKITSIDPANANIFYIDEYINENGTAGNVYPLRSVRFTSYADLIANYNTFTTDSSQTGEAAVFNYNFAGNRFDNEPIYAYVDDANSKPAVYQWTGSWSLTSGHFDGEWIQVRVQEGQARNDLIENIKIYDANRRTIITALEVYDPAKGIIPGFVDSEINFKSTADRAVYNYNSFNGYEENDDAWTGKWVGSRWWDLTTSIYLDYEQGPDEYNQQQWGRLFPGASIDIYEWVRSPVLPEEYENLVAKGGKIDGQRATGEAYSVIINGETTYYWTEQTYFNPIRKQSEINYFFWVKNKQSASGIRNYNVQQLSNILTNFGDLDISWAATSNNDKLLLGNVAKWITEDTVIQVNQLYDSGSLPLNEWTLIPEGCCETTIPEYLHIKLRDSLAGYNNYREKFTYSEWDVATVYYKDDVVIENGKFYICTAENTLQKYSLPSANAASSALNNWSRIYNYTLPPETEATDIEIWRGQPVPDLRLHPFNRYGHLTRPVQSLYRDISTARQNFVSAANDYLKDICTVSEITNWAESFYTKYTEGEVEYDLQHYWNFVDWVYREYDDCGVLRYEHDASIRPDFTFDTLPQIKDLDPNITPADVPDGSYVYIKHSPHEDGINRPEIWYKENGEYSLHWKKHGTIELSDELWIEHKFGHGFDAAGFDISGYDSGVANIINLLFDLFRDKIFIGQFKDKYNKLWFRCLYQAVIDGTADDFAFKTTYVKLMVDHPLIKDPKNYQHYSTTAIESYFADIKPFHTKLHTLEQRPHTTDAVLLEFSDEYKSEITIQMNDYSRQWCGDVLLSGGTFTNSNAEDTFAQAGYTQDEYFRDDSFSYEFTTPEADIATIYSGNVFIQPEHECIGEELIGLDLLENIRIRVQTNASGSTEDTNTRSFQINLFPLYNIQESIVIVDANKTTLSSDIDNSVTTIPLTDATAINDNSGVVWIGNERITYSAKDANNLLYCTRGTLGTSVTAHTSGDSVIDAGSTNSLPILENFAHNQNDLRPAYNQLGVSLAASGTEPDHAFIRDAGEGTI